MAIIKPFRGFRYDLKKAGSFASLISPPYDVLSEADRQKFYAKSPYNIVRLILGRGIGDWYKHSAGLWTKWQKSGLIAQDQEECLYIYRQDFTVAGRRYDRTGFIALLELEEPGKSILPHEKTFPGPVDDRFKLLKTARADFGQILLIYDDKNMVIDKLLQMQTRKKPKAAGEDDYGIKHTLWLLHDKNAVARIKAYMRKRQAVIADGHHRCQAALRFKKENPGLPSAGYVMATFVNARQKGCLVFPGSAKGPSLSVPLADSQPSASLLNKIFAVARARQTMPHKATYFYPKVYSGLVINKIGEAMGSGLHLSLPAGK